MPLWLNVEVPSPLQDGLTLWLITALGRNTLLNPQDRALRVFEEACELAQALGLSLDKCREQLAHTYSREPGDPKQEIAGVLNAAILTAECLDEDAIALGTAELTRVWSKIDEVRRKNLDKVQP